MSEDWAPLTLKRIGEFVPVARSCRPHEATHLPNLSEYVRVGYDARTGGRVVRLYDDANELIYESGPFNPNIPIALLVDVLTKAIQAPFN